MVVKFDMKNLGKHLCTEWLPFAILSGFIVYFGDKMCYNIIE